MNRRGAPESPLSTGPERPRYATALGKERPTYLIQPNLLQLL